MKQNLYTFASTEIVSAHALLERWRGIDASWLAETINISICERDSTLYPRVYLYESSYYDNNGTQIFKLKGLNTPPQIFAPEPGESFILARNGNRFCFEGYYFKADEIDRYERAHPNVLKTIQEQPFTDKNQAAGQEAREAREVAGHPSAPAGLMTAQHVEQPQEPVLGVAVRAAWEAAIATRQRYVARVRLEIWFKRVVLCEKVAVLEVKYKGRNIQRDVRNARKIDLPRLRLDHPDLPPLPTR